MPVITRLLTPHLLLQNKDKVCKYLAASLSDDVRRLFTYGFTIEDTQLSMWYADRARSVASEPFNFVTVSVTPRPLL